MIKRLNDPRRRTGQDPKPEQRSGFGSYGICKCSQDSGINADTNLQDPQNASECILSILRFVFRLSSSLYLLHSSLKK